MTDVSDVDDESFVSRRRVLVRLLLRPAVVVCAYLLILVGAVLAYRPLDTNELSLFGVRVFLLDWVTVLAAVVVAAAVVPGVVRSPARARSFLRAFVADRLAAGALVVLVTLLVVGVVGPLLLAAPESRPAVTLNPPLGFTVPSWVPTGCAGRVADEVCHGSLQFPLGTDVNGRSVLTTTVYGLWTAIRVGLSTAVIAGGIGAAVGITAGTVGGRLRAVLLRYVELQSAVPAFFVYVFLVATLGQGLALLVLVFGLTSWDGVARLSYAEVRRLEAKPYMRAATSAGAGTLYRVRRHIIPNLTTGMYVPLTTLVPLYVVYEAALSFLDLGASELVPVSLGREVAEGLDQKFVPHWWDVWWSGVVPAVTLSLFVVSLLVVGDRAGELLDPR